MEHELGRILGKLSDYKTCENCGRLNWYENDKCLNCEKEIFNDLEAKNLEWGGDKYANG